jgi:hypothetical protein
MTLDAPTRSPLPLSIGTLYREIGCREQVGAELTTAAGLYRVTEIVPCLA